MQRHVCRGTGVTEQRSPRSKRIPQSLAEDVAATWGRPCGDARANAAQKATRCRRADSPCMGYSGHSLCPLALNNRGSGWIRKEHRNDKSTSLNRLSTLAADHWQSESKATTAPDNSCLPQCMVGRRQSRALSQTSETLASCNCVASGRHPCPHRFSEGGMT
jgi:hypothetical protein